MQPKQKGNKTKQRMSAFNRWLADGDEVQITVNTTVLISTL